MTNPRGFLFPRRSHPVSGKFQFTRAQESEKKKKKKRKKRKRMIFLSHRARNTSQTSIIRTFSNRNPANLPCAINSRFIHFNYSPFRLLRYRLWRLKKIRKRWNYRISSPLNSYVLFVYEARSANLNSHRLDSRWIFWLWSIIRWVFIFQ